MHIKTFSLLMEEISKLFNNVHCNVKAPSQPFCLVVGDYSYFHYNCDGINDAGWGCGYRTLQTLCSWTLYNAHSFSSLKFENLHCKEVPSIEDIQKALISMNDKPNSFLSSQNWIGSFEVCICLDYFYNVPCKIHHIRSCDDFFDSIKVLWNHFSKFASPVMMGGDSDAASKCILGICGDKKDNCHLLILDPHCSKKHISVEYLIKEEWISWRNINSFSKSSFYNLCMPQCGIGNKKL